MPPSAVSTAPRRTVRPAASAWAEPTAIRPAAARASRVTVFMADILLAEGVCRLPSTTPRGVSRRPPDANGYVAPPRRKHPVTIRVGARGRRRRIRGDNRRMSESTTVLIVDDDVRLRDLLVRYLGQQGFSTLTAGSGRELDQQLKRHHVDLIVLDLMLPGEDGLTICRRLRGQGVETPIVMLTAKGDEIDRIVGLEIGADDYLPKPGSPRELVARMRAVLRRGRTPAGAPR